MQPIQENILAAELPESLRRKAQIRADEWVSITLRPIQEKTYPLSNLLEVRGGDFKDADEIDTYIRSERDSWDQ